MSLVFPKARLSVYNRLVEGERSCVKAIAGCASEYGLISESRLKQLSFPLESSGCGSLYAARQILEGCLSEHDSSGDSQQVAATVESTWALIEQSVQRYKEETALIHERKAGQPADILECTHMAPVVMDFLLQHLLPYI